MLVTELTFNNYLNGTMLCASRSSGGDMKMNKTKPAKPVTAFMNPVVVEEA